MTAIMNGLTVHGGFRPYGGTFLVFSDYARNAVRVAAIMHCPTTLVYTHDSIGLGEDGPTHQPIEHLAVVARHAQPAHLASLRRGGVGGVVGRGARAQERPDGAHLHAPGPAAAGAHARAAGRAAQGRLRAHRQQRSARSHRDRHGLGSRHSPPRPSRNCRPRANACAWCPCRAAKPSTRSPRRIARACCRPRARAASPSKRAPRSRGGATSARRAASWASRASAPRARARTCSSISV